MIVIQMTVTLPVTPKIAHSPTATQQAFTCGENLIKVVVVNMVEKIKASECHTHNYSLIPTFLIIHTYAPVSLQVWQTEVFLYCSVHQESKLKPVIICD